MRRLSIAALMLVVLVCGIAVAALKQASDAWAGGLPMLTLALRGTAVFGFTYRRENRRAFWFGFAKPAGASGCRSLADSSGRYGVRGVASFPPKAPFAA